MLLKFCLQMILCLAITSTSVAAEQYAIQGAIRYQIFLNPDNVLVDQEDDFIFTAQDCKWHILKTPKRYIVRGSEQQFGPTEVSSDITNFYDLVSVPQPASGDLGENALFARIGPGSVPFALSDPKLLILWYALGSTCYLAHSNNSANFSGYVVPPLTVGDQDKYAKDFRVFARWRLSSNAPYLPEQIVFDSTPRFLTTQEKGPWHLTNCVYEVQEFTHDAGLYFPKRMTADFYRKLSPKSQAISRAATMTITVKSINRSISVSNFRLVIPSSAMVSDMRTISSNTPFGVADFMADWPDLDRSVDQAETFAAMRKMRSPAVPSGSHRQMALCVIIAILLIPLLVLLVLFWIRKSQRGANCG